MSKRKLKKPIRSLLTWARRLVMLVIVLGIGLTIYGLVEPQDNTGTTITRNYQLVKESSRSAYIVRQSDDMVLVPSIVISYSVCGDYIAARRTDVPETDADKPDFTTFTYWLINTKTNTTQGPISAEDFDTACADNSLTFAEWLGT